MSKPFELHSKSFIGRADTAAFWEAWTGAVLSRSGLYTVHMPFDLATNAEERKTCMARWDLNVSAYWPYVYDRYWPCIHVEVKALNRKFFSPKDYPYDEVLVCSQNAYIRKHGPSSHLPIDYLFISQDSGAILWLPKGSPITLGHEILDSSRNELYKAVKSTAGCLKDLQAFVEYVQDGTSKEDTCG